MSTTKHKIFRIEIDTNSLALSKKIEDQINDFLADPNFVYINHSISTIVQDIEEYGRFKTTPKCVYFSLVYKDLSQTKVDLKGASKKIRSVVQDEIMSEEKMLEPEYKTEIDNLVNDNLDFTDKV